jgi:hypothetical protein
MTGTGLLCSKFGVSAHVLLNAAGFGNFKGALAENSVCGAGRLAGGVSVLHPGYAPVGAVYAKTIDSPTFHHWEKQDSIPYIRIK